MVNAPGTTLIDYIVPSGSSRNAALLKDGLLIVGFSIVMALSAQISFSLMPLTPVPVTLQTLFVLLAGAVLGSKRGGLAILLYLAEGATGLPVFQGLAGGVAHLLGYTAGYLWAMPIAAFVVGFLCERGLDRSYRTSALAMLPGTVIIYALGAAWLGVILHLSISQAVLEGIVPFIPGDLVKLVIAVALVPSTWRLIRRIKPSNGK